MRILYVFFLSVLCMLPAVSGARVNLTLVEVISSPERTDTLQTLIRQYESDNPNIKVEIITLPFGQAFEKLATMVAGGSAPDVVEMPGSWLSLYASNGMLLQLDEKVAAWDYINSLQSKILDLGRFNKKTSIFTIPYGLYLRALYYNRKLLSAAGIDHPPATMDDFMEDSRKISQLEGKYGYCMNGGSGGINAWLMFAAAMNGSNEFFTEDGKSRIDEPGSINGLQFLIDLYRKGYAPKDSITWGPEEVLSAFYNGTCAYLDQFPDGLISLARHMAPEDYAVAPIPIGPYGTAFPSLDFAGWSIFKSSKHPNSAWKLLGYLSSPEINKIWAKRTGAIPIHKDSDKDPDFQGDQFKGWFTQLNEPAYLPTMMPIYLPRYSYFAQTLALHSSQEALGGTLSAKEIAEQWALFLTNEFSDWKATQ